VSISNIDKLLITYSAFFNTGGKNGSVVEKAYDLVTSIVQQSH